MVPKTQPGEHVEMPLAEGMLKVENASKGELARVAESTRNFCVRR
jgi:hypothetical protein